jgi:hypothetical protein
MKRTITETVRFLLQKKSDLVILPFGHMAKRQNRFENSSLMKHRSTILILVLCCITFALFAQDSTTIKVLFLYGSKPKKEFKDVESEWFGGILGGHVGIQLDSTTVIDFMPSGPFHKFAHQTDFSSDFVTHDPNNFFSLFGSPADSVKHMTVTIPISAAQKKDLDSIAKAYLENTPYDYAFFGMRCGAAAYDILSQIDILKQYGHKRTYMKIFYPRKLRRRLVKQATRKNWNIEKQEGAFRRKWERD